MQKFLQPFPQLSLILSFSSFTQMKSQAVFGALVTWLLIGRTKQRANLTSLLKVRLEKSQQIQDLHVHTAMWLLLFCKITVNSETSKPCYTLSSSNSPSFDWRTDCVMGFCLGYAFLLFQEESSVQALIEACLEEDGKLYLCVSSPTIKDKPVSPHTGPMV